MGATILPVHRNSVGCQQATFACCRVLVGVATYVISPTMVALGEARETRAQTRPLHPANLPAGYGCLLFTHCRCPLSRARCGGAR